MVRRRLTIFAELKSEKGKVKPDQQEWLDAARRLPDAAVAAGRCACLPVAALGLAGDRTHPEIGCARAGGVLIVALMAITLSERVLDLAIGAGYSVNEIATALGITEPEVNAILANLSDHPSSQVVGGTAGQTSSTVATLYGNIRQVANAGRPGRSNADYLGIGTMKDAVFSGLAATKSRTSSRSRSSTGTSSAKSA